MQFNIKVLDGKDESAKEQEEKLRKPFHEDEEVDERIREAISAIQEGLDALQEQQRVDRNRQSLHSATNRSSHNGVVVDSIVETVVFMLSLLFQVSSARRRLDTSLVCCINTFTDTHMLFFPLACLLALGVDLFASVTCGVSVLIRPGLLRAKMVLEKTRKCRGGEDEKHGVCGIVTCFWGRQRCAMLCHLQRVGVQ